MNNETFTKPVTTFAALQAELNSSDDRCEYGSLAIATAEAACDLMRDDTYHSIIVVGGHNKTHYLDSIQVCKNDRHNCQHLPNLMLPVPLSGAQVVGLSNCIFLVAGGLNVNGTSNGMIYVGDICNQTWLHTESMPAALVEFSIVIGVDSLCLYGGINRDKLQNTTFCTSSKKKKMSAGAIVGIVFGVLFAVALIVGIAWCYKDRENKEGVWNKFLSKSRSLMPSLGTIRTNESEKTMADITTGHTEQANPLKATNPPAENNASTGNNTAKENTTSAGNATSIGYVQVAVDNKKASQRNLFFLFCCLSLMSIDPFGFTLVYFVDMSWFFQYPVDVMFCPKFYFHCCDNDLSKLQISFIIINFTIILKSSMHKKRAVEIKD
ncbi:hypothetical protein RFI_13962, partial [Reticulomyxa filosa]